MNEVEGQLYGNFWEKSTAINLDIFTHNVYVSHFADIYCANDYGMGDVFRTGTGNFGRK